jgi:hypothetical protein
LVSSERRDAGGKGKPLRCSDVRRRGEQGERGEQGGGGDCGFRGLGFMVWGFRIQGLWFTGF